MSKEKKFEENLADLEAIVQKLEGWASAPRRGHLRVSERNEAIKRLGKKHLIRLKRPWSR